MTSTKQLLKDLEIIFARAEEMCGAMDPSTIEDAVRWTWRVRAETAEAIKLLGKIRKLTRKDFGKDAP